AVEVREPHRTDRTVEGNPRDGQCRRRAVDRSDVVRVDLVGAEDGRDALHLVAEVGGKRRAQRTVGEATREDRLLTRPAFTTEERARDLSRGVHTLFDVDREREEVDALAGLGSTDSGQERGVSDL